MKLYAGNLPNQMTEAQLTSEFTKYGEVQSLKIITDRETGRSRGFGFVEMEDNSAVKAIDGMNDMDVEGRKISVRKADDKKQFNN
jgi:RNA recognition motif-containing protein